MASNRADVTNHVGANDNAPVNGSNVRVKDNENVPINGPETLLESDIRELSKKLPFLIRKDGSTLSMDEESHLISLFSKLKCTADSSRLSSTHGAAAINALSGFIDRASVVSVGDLKDLCFGLDTWKSVLEIFLQRWDDNKPKPMRMLLRSVSYLISRDPIQKRVLAKKNYAVHKSLTMINDPNRSVPVKAAFHVLDHLLSKDLVSATDILCAYGINDGVQTPAVPMHNLYQSHSTEATDLSNSKWEYRGYDFVLAILNWIQHSDIAADAGRLIGKFSHSFHVSSKATSKNSRPLWASPLQRFLQKHPASLEAIMNHVLPVLLKVDHNDTLRFLQKLPWASLGNGNSGDLSDADIVLCLLTAECVAETQLSDRSVKPTEVELSHHDIQDVAIGLLVHPAPSVQIRALSTIYRSLSSTDMLPADVLVGLKTSICYFHTEVDPRFRNEFVVIAKRLIYGIITVTFANKNHVHVDKRVGIEGSASNDREQDSQEEIAHRHFDFLKFYMHFLAKELQSTASYQRHIAALQIVTSSVKTFESLGSINKDVGWIGQRLYTRTLIRPLVDLMMDPFDDVRGTASSVLLIILKASWNPQTKSSVREPDDTSVPLAAKAHSQGRLLDLSRSLARAQTMLRATGRADHADGVARLYDLRWQSDRYEDRWHVSRTVILEELLTGLEEDVSITASDLYLAVGTRPLHGHLISLRYIISHANFYPHVATQAPIGSWDELKGRVISCCTGVWDAIKSILCVDSPEGHQANDQDEGNLDIGAKDTLSFAWRALKESSLLLHALLQAGIGGQAIARGLTREDFHKIGRLTFTQLAELRHRGAFSTVSQTFALCCTLSTQAEDTEINELPSEWYRNALSYIHENASALTRRSAGLPAMITGILSAHAGDDFFNNAILDLQAIADIPIQETTDAGGIRLPQVHALNCLKDIFASTRFGKWTDPYIEDSLDIAACCLESTAWAIRNSGLMLLNALIRRLNGGCDANSFMAPSSHRRLSTAAYEKFPSLPALITRLLWTNKTHAPRDSHTSNELTPAPFTSVAQRVFPALEILSALGLPMHHRAHIIHEIRHYMQSPAWSIREKAANTLALILPHEDVASEIKRLLQSDWSSQNALHGRLLCIRSLITRIEASLAHEYTNESHAEMRLMSMFRSDEDETKFSVVKFNSHRDRLLVANHCAITTAAYLDILNDILGALIQRRFARYFGLILQKHLFNEWRGTDIDRPLDRPVPKPALTLESLQEFISAGGEKPADHNRPSEPVSNLSICLQSRALMRCADLIKEACGGGLSSKLIDDLASKKYLQSYHQIPRDSPQQFDEALRTHGRLIGTAYASNADIEVLQRNLASWSCMLALAGDAHTEPSTRLAAVQSIEDFLGALLNMSSDKATSAALLRVYIALWDALVDDDEEVRDLAARVASKLLSRTWSSDRDGNPRKFPMSPVAVRPKLMELIKSRDIWANRLCEEAVLRLSGASAFQRMDSDTASKAVMSCMPPISEMISEARKPDTALFVEEKQNLYVDEMDEARCWADVLSTTKHADMATTAITTLSTWTLDGLACVARIIADEEDGPLGWTSKSEVYTLGIRIISAAKVLIHRGVEVDRYTMLLEDILQKGTENQLHDLWIVEIIEVLEAAGPDQGATTH